MNTESINDETKNKPGKNFIWHGLLKRTAMTPEKNNNEDHNRRNFLKTVLSLAGTVGLISSMKAAPVAHPEEKIKMLTPDGKLVEINKSKLSQSIVTEQATNKEVMEWMNSQNNNLQDGRK